MDNFPYALFLCRNSKRFCNLTFVTSGAYILNDAQNAIKTKKVCYFLDIPARITEYICIFANICY